MLFTATLNNRGRSDLNTSWTIPPPPNFKKYLELWALIPGPCAQLVNCVCVHHYLIIHLHTTSMLTQIKPYPDCHFIQVSKGPTAS